jgi:hypothetical protein
MIQSHDELIMEMADEYGLNHMGENNDDEDDEEDNSARGDAVAPLPLCHPLLLHHLQPPLRWSSSRKRRTLWRWFWNRRSLRSWRSSSQK